jgi:hypothetical protein
MAAASDSTDAAVVPVGEKVDAMAGAAGIPELACLVAVDAVLVAVLGVHTHALATRLPGAPSRHTDGGFFRHS